MLAVRRWIAPEMWEFADPDLSEDYPDTRRATWARAKETSLRRGDAVTFVSGCDEMQEHFTFNRGVLTGYERRYLSESECDA